MQSYLIRDAEDRFNVKFRLNHLQLCIKYGRKNADLVKRRLLSVLAKCEIRA